MINTFRACRFTDECSNCLVQNICISATKMASQKRKFTFSLKNKPIYSLKTKELFKKGTARHDEYQKDIKDIDEYGFYQFRKDLYKGKRIKLQELKVCSTLYGHGVIDVVTLQFKDGVMNVWIDELKSSFSKHHYMQLVHYARILSDKHCKIIYKVPMIRRKKFKRMLGHFHHAKVKTINIKGRIYIFSNKFNQDYWQIVKDNKFTKTAEGLNMALSRRMKCYQGIMAKRVIDASSIKYCKGCTKDKKKKWCGYLELCSSISYKPQEKQRYYGKKNLLVKTKPRVIL